MTKTSGIVPGRLVSEWADLYSRRLYNLAFFEAESATEREPENALHWFLLGETALARNRPDLARSAFTKALEVLPRQGSGGLPERVRKNLGEAARRLESVLESNPMLPAPAEPFQWIESPTSIEERASLGAASQAGEGPAVTMHQPGSLVEDVEIFDKESRPSIAEERPELTDAPAPVEERPAQPVPAKEGKPAAREEKKEAAPPAEEDPWRVWEQKLLQQLSQGKYESAHKMVNDAVGRYPENTWLREARAKVLDRMGDREGAARDLLEAFKGMMQQGNHRDGAKVAREAMSLARGNGNLIMALAAAAAGGGMMALASEAYSLGVETERRSGDPVRLRNALGKALEAFPGNQSWRQELTRLSAGMGRGGTGQQNPPAHRIIGGEGTGLPAPRLDATIPPVAGAGAGRSAPSAASPEAPGATDAALLLGATVGGFMSLIAMIAGFGLVGWACFFALKAAENASDFSVSPSTRRTLGTIRTVLLIVAIIGSLRTPVPL